MDRRLADWAVRAIALMGVAAFWAGIGLAASRYPAGYDWQYMVVSRLFSPRRDPAGYAWAAGGVVLCSVCLFCWASVLARRQSRAGGPRRGWGWGLAALRLGSLCMAATTVLPDWLARLGKLHELLALAAFGALCLGIVRMTFQLVLQGTAAHDRRRAGAAAIAGAAVAPVLLAGLAQLYVFYALPALHWVNPAWRAAGVWVGYSFAFWEWVTCGVLTAYALVLILAARAGGVR